MRIQIKIENLDNYSFECGIGFHPWFNISKISKIFINDFSYKEIGLKNFNKEFIIDKMSNQKEMKINEFTI